MELEQLHFFTAPFFIFYYFFLFHFSFIRLHCRLKFQKSEKSEKKCKLVIANFLSFCYNSGHGGIAQLGERLNGIQEVMGSNPTISMSHMLEVLIVQDFQHIFCLNAVFIPFCPALHRYMEVTRRTTGRRFSQPLKLVYILQHGNVEKYNFRIYLSLFNLPHNVVIQMIAIARSGMLGQLHPAGSCISTSRHPRNAAPLPPIFSATPPIPVPRDCTSPGLHSVDRHSGTPGQWLHPC